MSMINGIKGIQRKTTAVEGTQRFFQTVNLIISHFKRDADKEKIFELIEGDESTLKGLLNATAAVHIYHNLGIRVKDSLELGSISVDSTKKIELNEKNIFKDEVKSLLKESLSLEIDMLNKMIDLENNMISLLIEERGKNLTKFEKERFRTDIDQQIEQDLIEIILNYPPFYFYDLIGDLIGLSNNIKMEVLEESSGLKELSVEIERKLQLEEKEDKFIELATLNRLISRTQKEFEFRSYKELQMQAMPVRMLKRRILDYNLDKFPISIPGLKAFQKANNLKKELIEKIEMALNEKVNYEEFEISVLSFLKSEIIDQLKSNPNDFIYFLQNLNECNFSDLVFTLHKYGIYNVLDIMNTDSEIAEKVQKNMVRYNIKKFDILNLNDQKKDLIFQAKKIICSLDIPFLSKITDGCDNLDNFNLVELLYRDGDELNELWKVLEERLEFPIQNLKEYARKRDVIDKIFINQLNLTSYSQILFLLNFEEILENLVKDVFFNIFSKILRQLSRIIELFLKVTNDKALFLVALKKIYGTTESEEWVRIKLEELIIERLMKRQEELVVVFNAPNQPFLVNGFILARITDSSLNEGMSELQNETSPIYEDVMPLTLNSDIISPISYCISYDLIKRFESFEELRKLKVEQIIESKEKEEAVRIEKLREKQEGSTLNWIERRITSSIMGIASTGINPNQLYWQEKDDKIATDNIKLHSELKGDPITLFTEYFHFAIDKINSFNIGLKLPDLPKLNSVVANITNDVMKKRLKHEPTPEEIKKMIEGERFDIAKEISKRIGKILDKALYTKFKSKRRNG